MHIKRSLSRRGILKWGVSVVAGAVIASGMSYAAEGSDNAFSAHAFVTDNTGLRHAPLDQVLGGSAPPDATFAFDAAAPQQTILGFGAALTEAACTNLNRLNPADRDALLDELYNPDKSNFSTGRLCIGASDYSTKLYSYDDGEPDPKLSRFSIDHDRAAVLPILQQARKIRPDLFLFASPWSPPGWMKYGGSMLGGNIKPYNLDVYARYIVRYLQAYHDAGVGIDAMTVQNEIDADQNGTMPACAWPEETEAQYIVQYLGPQVAASKLTTQIWILDHNYNLVSRVLNQLNNARVRAFVSAVAWHGYAGSVEQIISVRNQYPQIAAHWTEGGDLTRSPTVLTAWANWAQTFAGILNCGVSSLTTWNLALDEHGGPNIGPFQCTGLVTIDSKTKSITRNGIYWSLVHYAKAMPRGSRVLRSTSTGNGSVSAVAARRLDGSTAVVVSNAGRAVRIRIDVGGKSQMLSAGENSVTTLILP